MVNIIKDKPGLRTNRIAIYKKHVRTRGLFKGVNGETFHVPETLTDRQSNFKKFVALNFETDPYEPGVWPNYINDLPVYRKLKLYSETRYGSAMIYRILQDNKKAKSRKEKIFKIQYDDGESGQSARGGLNFIRLSKNFPNNNPYKGGDKKHDLAIIHHEFGHTRFFRKQNNLKIIEYTIEDERQAVMNLENPVRIENGLEPRYTYYNGSRTINIITGMDSPVEHTILESDPAKLVKIGSAGAFRK